MIQLPTAEGATLIRVSLAGETVDCSPDDAMSVADRLATKHRGVPSFAYFAPAPAAPAAPALAVSTFAAPVVNDAAKTRIDAQHAALAAAGLDVGAHRQAYATGTRMAAEGYARQHARRAEHEAARPIEEAAAELAAAVAAEGRADVEVSARDLARSLAVNGKITACGFALSEQAIRGLLARIESPALSYVLGLRSRIVETVAAKGDPREDKAQIARVLAHECERAPDTRLKLRTRKASGDVFAIVSPAYSPADAPEVVKQILRDMPRDAKGTWSYDPGSTAWELRASVWTPTPVEEQAVGEPFSGYVSFRARDNGTAKFRGGGGVELVRCLNASVYVAESGKVDRVHRGASVLYDVRGMMRGATAAIAALCKAWGANRAADVELPERMSVAEALPGFWRSLLTDRRSELAGVLPGRTEHHVAKLAAATQSERRVADRLVRSDLAQGWTRYVQDLPTDARRDAELAIGDWLVTGARRPLGHVAAS